MHRRLFVMTGLSVAIGCRGTQHGKVLTEDKKELVGSHTAGGEIYKPLIDDALGKLLARQSAIIPVGGPNPQPGMKSVCFVGLENKSAEDLGDFKEQIIQTIDTKTNQSGTFKMISRRYVDVGLRETKLRPDELMIPARQRQFLAVMEAAGQPFEYLLFAMLTSGTTRDNGDSTREYLLTLEIVNLQTGTSDKESASLRKGYTASHLKKW